MGVQKDIQEVLCRIQYILGNSLFERLNTANMKYAVVKGCPLAYYKTGNPGTRVSSDIDILIQRQDVNQITRILDSVGFRGSYKINREERVMLIMSSHQLPSYRKTVDKFGVDVDVNFDLFWGEYTGKRIDVAEFLEDAIDMEIYGCKIKTLPPLKMMIQIILHHYKEMNSIYHLTGHVAIKKRLFEDIYIMCRRYPEEISVDNLYNICSRYEIIPYAYYMFYYTRKVYDDSVLDAYIDAFRTEEGQALLNCYGLSAQERRQWKINFEERLDKDVSEQIYEELEESDIEKLERSRRLFG